MRWEMNVMNINLRIPLESCGRSRWRAKVQRRSRGKETRRDRFVSFVYFVHRLCHLGGPICWVCDKLSEVTNRPTNAARQAELLNRFYWPVNPFRQGFSIVYSQSKPTKQIINELWSFRKYEIFDSLRLVYFTRRLLGILRQTSI